MTHMASFVYSVKTKKWLKYSGDLFSYEDLLNISNSMGNILLMRLQEEEARALEEEQHRKAEYEQRQREETEKRRFESKDPYVVLGISKVSSRAEVRRAYMKLARTYHPDLFSDAGAKSAAEERMKRINGARDTLFAILM